MSGRSVKSRKSLDSDSAVPDNTRDMDNPRGLAIAALAVSSCMLWNWWAVPTAR
jgi:hypothetical protein